MVELIDTETKTHELTQTPHRLSVHAMCRLLGVTRAEVYRPHLPKGFCYLAAMLDAFSRRVVGWRLESYLTSAR